MIAGWQEKVEGGRLSAKESARSFALQVIVLFYCHLVIVCYFVDQRCASRPPTLFFAALSLSWTMQREGRGGGTLIEIWRNHLGERHQRSVAA